MRRARQHHLPLRNESRQRLVHETARLMAETGIHDYGQAKRKAARRLGIADAAMLPRNEEIQTALREYQRLFQGETQPLALRQLRDAAVAAMAFFAEFAPRLTGPVLDGTADAHSESDIPADAGTATIRLDKKRSVDVPEWRFMADDAVFALKVLPLTTLHQAPLSAFDDKPAPRATAAQVRALLDGVCAPLP